MYTAHAHAHSLTERHSRDTISKDVLSSIDEVVQSGRAVVSGDDATIITIVQEALKESRRATFYVIPSQYRAFLRWYWTPKRMEEIGMELVSQEELERIERELDIRDLGEFYSNRIPCPCGGAYGAFEFIQQGIREHGRDWVEVVLEFKHAAVIHVNRASDPICPKCHKPLIFGDYCYAMDGYCCTGVVRV
jgi:hypothetical protein